VTGAAGALAAVDGAVAPVDEDDPWPVCGQLAVVDLPVGHPDDEVSRRDQPRPTPAARRDTRRHRGGPVRYLTGPASVCLLVLPVA
jgi:hypothetical protein